LWNHHCLLILCKILNKTMERNSWVSRPSSVSWVTNIWSVCNFYFDSVFVIKLFFNGSIPLLRLERDQNSKIIYHIFNILQISMRHTVHIWLRHCTTGQVAGPIPDGVIGFSLTYPSGHTMALVLTQPLTEMSTRIMS